MAVHCSKINCFVRVTAFVKNCIFEKSLIKSSFITAFIAEITRHIKISCLGTYVEIGIL
ncbi:conserved hypothetical protein [Trichinella spiralis]|uniref:hypothetical protein n=1 Tax=Trichinella spiralis TaxID=6334 RepID=UPI0001EFB97F|nr:conserved hypothetical protein [Trichinella spiralis]